MTEPLPPIQDRKRLGCGAWTLILLGVIVAVGICASVVSDSSSPSASRSATTRRVTTTLDQQATMVLAFEATVQPYLIRAGWSMDGAKNLARGFCQDLEAGLSIHAVNAQLVLVAMPEGWTEAQVEAAGAIGGGLGWWPTAHTMNTNWTDSLGKTQRVLVWVLSFLGLAFLPWDCGGSIPLPSTTTQAFGSGQTRKEEISNE